MMKKFALFTLLATAFAVADTTVEFPLLVTTYTKKNKEVKVNVVSLNKALNKKKLAGLPVTVIVKKDSKAFAKVLQGRLEAANKEKVWKTELLSPINAGAIYEYPVFCYRGDIKEVQEIVQGLFGGFISDEQGLLAVRYKNKKNFLVPNRFKNDQELKKEYSDNEKAVVEEWLEFDEKSNEVLILSDNGPQGDGTELYTTSIEPCPAK